MCLINKIGNYVQDKKIILVGPSSHLRNAGNFINTFESVIRVNLTFPVPINIQKDFGSKTNIVFTWFGLNTKQLQQNPQSQTILDYLVINPNCLSHPFIDENIQVSKTWAKKNNVTLVDWNFIYVENNYNGFGDYYKASNTTPTTGVKVLNYLTSNTNIPLYLTGYSFNIIPSYSTYPFFCVETKKITNANRYSAYKGREIRNLNYYLDNWHFGGKHHFNLLDMLFTKDLYQRNLIKIDFFLEKLFDLIDQKYDSNQMLNFILKEANSRNSFPLFGKMTSFIK